MNSSVQFTFSIELIFLNRKQTETNDSYSYFGLKSLWGFNKAKFNYFFLFILGRISLVRTTVKWWGFNKIIKRKQNAEEII